MRARSAYPALENFIATTIRKACLVRGVDPPLLSLRYEVASVLVGGLLDAGYLNEERVR